VYHLERQLFQYPTVEVYFLKVVLSYLRDASLELRNKELYLWGIIFMQIRIVSLVLTSG